MSESLVVDVLLGVGVAAQLLCCVGVLVMRDAFDRLHYAGAGSNVGAFLILAPILPIISDIGGSGGSQAIAVTIRELAQGRIKPSDYAWVMAKEVGVGVVNGLVLGVLLGIGTFVATGARGVEVGVVVAVGGFLEPIGNHNTGEKRRETSLNLKII